MGDEIAGKVVLNKATEYTQALTLPYQSKWISLSFKEIGLGNYRNKYQYFIEGFSDSWQYIDIDKPITFSQLQPGKYILWIRQIGAENSAPCYHLNMTILPPWWQTVWFNTIEVFFVLLLLVLAVITGSVNWNVQALLKNGRKKNYCRRKRASSLVYLMT